MERLKVDNFLGLKSVDLEVRSMNVLIGPQASGKSLIAKLLYFFQDFLTDTYLHSIQTGSTKKEIQQKGTEKFEKYFPRYTWSQQEFEIRYQIEDSEVAVYKGQRKAGQKALQIDYSSDLVNLHKRLKNAYNRKLEQPAEQDSPIRAPSRTFEAFYSALDDCVYKQGLGSTFPRSIFIPASRSFFANLQKNVFSFLASNIDIDPFLAEFGQQYESSKRLMESVALRRRGKNEIKQEVESLVQEILVGKYKYEDEQDWIEGRHRKVNVTNASSGQQEALPMLLILSTLPFIFRYDRSTLFIEEPEAHLFPVSQSRIVELLVLLYREFNHRFFLTTHSPYILTALNNLILADDVMRRDGEDATDGIVDRRFRVSYEEVGAYTIADGKLCDIKDEESRIIGADVIDSVSDEFDSVFDRLLSIQQGVG